MGNARNRSALEVEIGEVDVRDLVRTSPASAGGRDSGRAMYCTSDIVRAWSGTPSNGVPFSTCSHPPSVRSTRSDSSTVSSGNALNRETPDRERPMGAAAVKNALDRERADREGLDRERRIGRGREGEGLDRELAPRRGLEEGAASRSPRPGCSRRGSCSRRRAGSVCSTRAPVRHRTAWSRTRRDRTAAGRCVRSDGGGSVGRPSVRRRGSRWCRRPCTRSR